MTDTRKIEKLRILFDTVPEAVLRQLHLALEYGSDSDPDGLPYGELINLINEVAESRGLAIGTPEIAALQDSLTETTELSDQSSELTGSDPLLLEESVEILSEALASDDSFSSSDFQPPRNAMHAFFGPFESLIIDPPKFQPRIDGYICSTSLPAIWRLLNEESSGGIIRDAWIKAEILSEPGDQVFYGQITEQMHVAARDVLDDLASRSREDPAVRRALISRLGSSAILGDLFEFQTLVPLGARLQAAFARVKPSLSDLSEASLATIAGIINEEAKANAAMAGYLQLSVLSNLAEPWSALRLQSHLNCDQETVGLESCLIADHLIALVTAQPDWLERLILQGPVLPETVAALKSFSLTVDGLSREFEALPENDALQARLQPVVERGSAIFAGVLKHAFATIRLTLPRLPGQRGSTDPDLTWFDREADAHSLCEEALLAASFLSEAGSVAMVFGKGSSYRRTKQAAAREIDSFADQLVKIICESAGVEMPLHNRISSFLIDLTGCLSGVDARTKAQQVFEKAVYAA